MNVISAVKATRAEKLALKRKIVLSERAHKILTLKLDALMLELFRAVHEAKSAREHLNTLYGQVETETALAYMLEGTIGVKIAAESIEYGPDIHIETHSVMGVPVPKLKPENVKKPLLERGYSLLGTTALIDDLATLFEDLILQIITCAEKEWVIRLISSEIERTKRRVSALENMVIPNLTESLATVEERRDEIEREEFSRLFLLKKKRRTEEELVAQ